MGSTVARRPLLAGGHGPLWVGTSWKMNGTGETARAYCAELLAAGPESWRGVQPFVVPPATVLGVVSDALRSSDVIVGAQNAHWADSGAWTGEVSVPQVADAGARIIEIGHSERREHFGETDRTVNRKVRSVLDHGLRPLVCVGESREVFEAGASVAHVLAQVAAALDGITDTSRVLLAYEPIWAIGERGRPPAEGDLDAVCAAIGDRFGGVTQALLYGGSVDARNARRLLELPAVTGLFVGRAAWRADGFLEILRLARTAAESWAEEAGRAVSSRRAPGSGAPVG